MGFIILLVGIFSCVKKEPADDADMPTSGRDGMNVLQVSVVQAEKEPLETHINSAGKIEPGKRQELSFQVNGALSGLHMINGRSVSKGQVLAQLANWEQELEVREAELAYKLAVYQNKDELMFLNDSTFYKKQWQQVNEKTSLNSGVPQAKLALEKARINLDHTTLIAPFSGVVSDLTVVDGDFISANKKIASLFDPQNLEIVVNLLEYDFPKVKVGQQVAVHALPITHTEYTGRVAEINPSIDATGHFEVTVKLTGSTGGLTPGMSANVSIVALKEEQVVVVPLKAVVNKSGKSVVFTYEEGLAKWNYVTLGEQNGEYVEIIDGINAKSQVIITDVFQLAHDSPVSLEPPKTESSTASL